MTNRKIRDTVFCHYMSTPAHLLELFNALNGTDYKNPTNININTLEGSFFSNIKNDISFMMDNLVIVLIEHQTTINPNMPLRFLSYLDELYRRIINTQNHKIYGNELIKIPAPEFYVFYDGEDTSFDQQILKLSDAFKSPSENLELIAHVYNLADGKTENLKQNCFSLREYSIFSNRYKYYRKQKLTIDESVREAVHYCLEHNIMADYLKNNESEVIDMFGFEWNEREEKEALLKSGEAHGTLNAIKNLMKNLNMPAENAMKALGIAPSEYQKYLMML